MFPSSEFSESLNFKTLEIFRNTIKPEQPKKMPRSTFIIIEDHFSVV